MSNKIENEPNSVTGENKDESNNGDKKNFLNKLEILFARFIKYFFVFAVPLFIAIVFEFHILALNGYANTFVDLLISKYDSIVYTCFAAVFVEIFKFGFEFWIDFKKFLKSLENGSRSETIKFERTRIFAHYLPVLVMLIFMCLYIYRCCRGYVADYGHDLSEKDYECFILRTIVIAVIMVASAHAAVTKAKDDDDAVPENKSETTTTTT